MVRHHRSGWPVTLAATYLAIYAGKVLADGFFIMGGGLDRMVSELTWQPANGLYWLYVISILVILIHIGTQRYRRKSAIRESSNYL